MATSAYTRKSVPPDITVFQHQEIVDNIIDYVREASGGHFRAPLKSCSLVSKAWLPRSQRHLFHHVRLQYEAELKRWCKNITKERAKVLSTYVRWLSYSPPYKTKDKNALERFAYFTHVETLCIFKVDFIHFRNDKPALQSAFGHFGNSVRYLVIDRCIGHFPTLINLFRVIPNFTHLDIFHSSSPYPCLVTSDDTLGYFEKVEALRMTGTERYFINMLMPERFTGLKHISYFDKGPESPGDLGLLLSNCKKTLETLTVLSSHSVTNLTRWWSEEYTLESCQKLREIAFDNMHANRPNPEITAVLPTINSRHFTTVTFLAQNANVNFDYPSDKHWRKIDEVLTVLGESLVKKYKRKLEVVFDGWKAPVEDEHATQRWIGLLPEFAQVGKITFKYMDPPPRTYDPPTWRSLTRDVVKEE
ncbi:hypothetical protein BDM02DRAFT_3118316 [Thelephora ganbajun]|uniref:Uncharacterized protein n=1 Tax=Thelephora ganbajun TaxID=370292 RepID=A0ACB6ZBJ7_THEGA|nr:hypothetical protein BDM02DRAFT_3118316 [Thelephora ganbajun]